MCVGGTPLRVSVHHCGDTTGVGAAHPRVTPVIPLFTHPSPKPPVLTTLPLCPPTPLARHVIQGSDLSPQDAACVAHLYITG